MKWNSYFVASLISAPSSSPTYKAFLQPTISTAILRNDEKEVKMTLFCFHVYAALLQQQQKGNWGGNGNPFPFYMLQTFHQEILIKIKINISMYSVAPY